MDVIFHKKVRSAAVAGWWTLLVAVLLGVFSWTGYLVLWRFRPDWMAPLWGGASWEDVQSVTLSMFATYKLITWMIFLVTLWLSIWSCKLKHAE